MTPIIGSRRVPLEDVLDRLGDGAANAVVHVMRQPGGSVGLGDGGNVRLSALDNFHTRKRSGGRNEASYFPHLYAYGSCTDLPVAHSGSHGDCPHVILACVTGAERDEVWEVLCELTGHDPPTDEAVRRECEKVKHEVLERLDAGTPQDELKRRSGGGVPTMFNNVIDQEVGPVVYALARADDDVLEETWYLDMKTGAVVADMESSGIDMRQHPHEEGRYEEIQPLAEEELSLLTVDDLREIRDAFLASRGFKP